MHLQMEWREATAADVPALLELIVAAYRGPGGWTSEAHLVAGERIGADQLRAAIGASDALVMVVPAPLREGLLACCELRDRGGGVASFGMFAVDPARQAAGIGRRLLTAARALAAERFGADTLEIWVVSAQHALIAWYERLGFTATGESVPFPEDGRDRPIVEGLRFIVMRAPTRRAPYALSWSGGKDSALALHVLAADGGPEPVSLVTTVVEGQARVSAHGVRAELVLAQAGALGLDLVQVALPTGASNEVHEQRLAQALAAPPLDRAAELAFGDLFLADIRAFRERACAAIGRRAVFPLWRRDTAALARRVIDAGFRARIVCVDAARLDPSFAGREYDERLLAELPDTIDPCGENGEFHTFVYDGPGFAAPVGWRPGEIVERDGFVFADLVGV